MSAFNIAIIRGQTKYSDFLASAYPRLTWQILNNIFV